jgi:hypothetical protein
VSSAGFTDCVAYARVFVWRVIPKAVTTTPSNWLDSPVRDIFILLSLGDTSISFGANPTELTDKTALPLGTLIEKLPSAEAETALVLPLSVMVAAEIPLLSAVDNTLPVIVRFCANNIVPNNKSGTRSKCLITDISVTFFWLIIFLLLSD